MTWTTPKTWTSEPLLSSDLNTQLRDNLEALKSPPTDIFTTDNGTNYSIGNVGWADVDATDFSLTITPSGDTVLIGFRGVVTYTTDADGFAFLDVELNNTTRLGGDDGLAVVETKAPSGGIITNTETVAFLHLLTGLTPNQQITLKLKAKITNGFSVLVYGNNPASTISPSAQFWVREIS